MQGRMDEIIKLVKAKKFNISIRFISDYGGLLLIYRDQDSANEITFSVRPRNDSKWLCAETVSIKFLNIWFESLGVPIGEREFFFVEDKELGKNDYYGV